SSPASIVGAGNVLAIFVGAAPVVFGGVSAALSAVGGAVSPPVASAISSAGASMVGAGARLAICVLGAPFDAGAVGAGASAFSVTGTAATGFAPGGGATGFAPGGGGTAAGAFCA